VRFTTDDEDECFSRGKGGKGRRVLEHINLQQIDDFSNEVLREAVAAFENNNIKIRDIAWFGSFWKVTVINRTDVKELASLIASHLAYYEFALDVLEPDPAALRSKLP
jgi:hypothetical protein